MDSAAAARLNKKQYRDVRVTVDNGIATLQGSVELYEYKADAARPFFMPRAKPPSAT